MASKATKRSHGAFISSAQAWADAQTGGNKRQRPAAAAAPVPDENAALGLVWGLIASTWAAQTLYAFLELGVPAVLVARGPISQYNCPHTRHKQRHWRSPTQPLRAQLARSSHRLWALRPLRCAALCVPRHA